MPDESTTPDLVELVRRCFQAISAGDLDEAQRFLMQDAVLDMTRTIGVVVSGRDALRAFQEDWLAGYDEVAYTAEEIVDAGNGVAFVRVLQTARPKGTAGHVTQREPNVLITEDGRVVRMIIYPESELDEARAAAERLAQERRMAEETATPDLVEIVRRANDAFNRRDVDAWMSFYSPDIVYRPVPSFPDSQERQGLGAMRRWMEEWHDAWADDYTTQAESIREYGDVVIALLRFTGHAKASGVEVAGGIFEVYRFHDGKIASVEDFTDRAEALKAAGLEE